MLDGIPARTFRTLSCCREPQKGLTMAGLGGTCWEDFEIKQGKDGFKQSMGSAPILNSILDRPHRPNKCGLSFQQQAREALARERPH